MNTESPTNPSKHDFWKVFLLALFFGFLGVHRFVVGKTKTGILQLITFGGLGLWAFVDIVLILLGKFTDEKNQTIANPSPKDAWKVFGVAFLFGLGIYGGFLEKNGGPNGGPSGDWESTAGNKCRVTSDMITFYVDDSIALAGYYTKGGPDVEVEGNTKRINYGALRMVSNHGPAFMGALRYEKVDEMETLYFSFLNGTQEKQYTLHRK